MAEESNITVPVEDTIFQETEAQESSSPPELATETSAPSEEPQSEDHEEPQTEPPTIPQVQEENTADNVEENTDENEPGLVEEPTPAAAASTDPNPPMGSLLDADEDESDNDENVDEANDPTADGDDFVHVETAPEASLRDEESKLLNGAEILFSRSKQYHGWDNLRWMAHAGARKLVFFETVYQYQEKPKSFMNFLAGEEYTTRQLAVYEEPSVILILRQPESMDELKTALCVDNDSEIDTSIRYWIVESVVDTHTCKLRVSALTTVTSILAGVQDNEFRRKSCFELITPTSSIILSAIQLRNGGAVRTSFIDSGAFLETSSAELVLQRVICMAHQKDASSSLQSSSQKDDMSWKHQIILGTLHSYVILGNKDLLDQGIAKARKAQQAEAKRMGDADLLAEKFLDPRVIDAFDESGKTPLHYACTNRFTMGVLALVAAGANMDIRIEPYNLTPTHVCAQKLDDKSLTSILQKNRRPNVVDEFGRTPMYLAITEGHTVGGMPDPQALDRCLAVLNAHGGDLGDLSTFRHPISHHARMWNHEILTVILRHVNHRYPLFPPNSETDPKKRGISASALFHYPLHSALISFRENLKIFCEDRDPQELHSICVDAEARLTKILETLYSCGFEPNERIEAVADQFSGSEKLASYIGFAPIQILYRSGLDVLEHKGRIPETSYRRIVDTIGKLAECMVSKGSRFIVDVPPTSRPRVTESDTTVDAAKLVERGDELKIESNKELPEVFGGLDSLKAAAKTWEALKPASTESKAFVFHTDNKTVIENDLAAGGSDEKSCFICWKQFGKLMNRKHRCRITKRYICDDCSSKRVVHNGEEHRISDGQYLCALLGKIDVAPKTSSGSSASANRGNARAADSKRDNVSSRLDRLEAAEQANRDSLFGSFLDNASKAMFGDEEETDKATAQAEGLAGLSNQLGETRNMLLQRGEKLNTLQEKSERLASASEDFANMAKKLNQSTQGGFFW